MQIIANSYVYVGLRSKFKCPSLFKFYSEFLSKYLHYSQSNFYSFMLPFLSLLYIHSHIAIHYYSSLV